MDPIEKQPAEISDEVESLKDQVTSKVGGKNVEIQSGLAGQVSAEQDVTMTSSVAGIVAAGQNMEMNQSRAQIAAVGQDLKMDQGAIGLATVGHDLSLGDGMVGFANAGSQVTVQRGMVAVAISPQINLGENGQVLLTTPQAAALGAALGAGFAIITWILRRITKRG